MEAGTSNSRGPDVTTLVAGLSLFLLVVVFTISTLCASPSPVAGIAPSDPQATGTRQAETHQYSVSSSLFPPAVVAPEHDSTDSGPPADLRVISFSLAGLASSEPRFNGLVPALSTVTDRPDPSTPVTPPVPAPEDASLVSLAVVEDGTGAVLAPGFDPDVTHYGLTVNAAAVNVVAETTVVGARIVSTTIGDETTAQDPPGNRLSADVSVAEGSVNRFSVTVQARDGVTTRTYYLDLSRPGPVSVPGNAARFGFG